MHTVHIYSEYFFIHSSCLLGIILSPNIYTGDDDLQVLLPGSQTPLSPSPSLHTQGVSNATSTLVYLDANAQACKRIWCLFEIWTALVKHPDLAHGGIHFVSKNNLVEMTRIFSQIDIERASASFPADYKTIMTKIRRVIEVTLSVCLIIVPTIYKLTNWSAYKFWCNELYLYSLGTRRLRRRPVNESE